MLPPPSVDAGPGRRSPRRPGWAVSGVPSAPVPRLARRHAAQLALFGRLFFSAAAARFTNTFWRRQSQDKSAGESRAPSQDSPRPHRHSPGALRRRSPSQRLRLNVEGRQGRGGGARRAPAAARRPSEFFGTCPGLRPLRPPERPAADSSRFYSTHHPRLPV